LPKVRGTALNRNCRRCARKPASVPGRIFGWSRIRGTSEIEAARTLLKRITPGLPQYDEATHAIDRLILDTVRAAVRSQSWTIATEALALLSAGARGTPEAIAAARAVYVPIAQQKIGNADWSAATDAIVAAQAYAVPMSELRPLQDALRTAGLDAATTAKRERDARARLLKALAAEEILVSWERTTESWGTPALIALRTEMARDVAAVERSERRRGAQ